MKEFHGIELNGERYYRPQPKQKLFHELILNRLELGIDKILQSGAAGSGKSLTLRWEAHRNCLSGNNVRGLLMRSSFPELYRTHLAVDQIHMDFRGNRDILRYNEQKHVCYYPVTNSVLEFGYGDKASDFSQYLSAQYDFIIIDELTTIPFELTLGLMSRLRTIKADFSPFFCAATNPGDIAHIHVKSYFIDKDFDKKFPEMSSRYEPEKIATIYSTVYDNYALMAADPSYVGRLESLNENDKKRFLHGSWELFQGQFFGDFDTGIHVVDRNYYDSVKSDISAVLAAMDYGTYTYAYIVEQMLDGTCFVLAEFEAIGLQTSEKALRYRNFLDRWDCLNIWTIGDTNMFYQPKEYADKPPPVEDFEEQGLKFKRVSKSSDEKHSRFRVFCNSTVKDMLSWQKDDNGLWIKKPKLFILDQNCPALLRTLPLLPTSDKNDEDIEQDLPNGTDDPYDALKYALISFREKDRRHNLESTKSKISRQPRMRKKRI